MKQIRMKRFGMILFALSMALVMSCSKEDVESNSEPVIPVKTKELTGKFEGKWSCMSEPSTGTIEVYDNYFIIYELPTKTIVDDVVHPFRSSYSDHPEIKDQLKDSIGNFFFASSYQYPTSSLSFKYQLNSFSDESYWASISDLRDRWSFISLYIYTDSGESICIGPSAPYNISFNVEADGVSYRIDMISKEHEVSAEFNMKTGMWTFYYWFSTYRIYNLQTGQQYEYGLKWALVPSYRKNKEDTNYLKFQSSRRTGPVDGNIVYY